MNQETPNTYVPMLLTFLAGAALGAVVVALTTPKSGPALRNDLKGMANRAKFKACDLADEASEAWDGLKDRTAMAATDLKRGFNDAANDLRATT